MSTDNPVIMSIFMLVAWAAIIFFFAAVLWRVVKSAVKNGVLEALAERDKKDKEASIR